MPTYDDDFLAATALCGCAAFTRLVPFLRRLLADEDKMVRLDMWEQAVTDDPLAAAELLMHWATELDMLEHGTSIRGSWLASGRGQVVKGLLTESENDNITD